MGSAKSPSSRSDAGFSLVEVLVATLLLATALTTLGQLFALSARSNIGARSTTYTAMLAQQKLEELRALTWGFDTQGLPISDTASDTTVSPEAVAGGTGLAPSPAGSLGANTVGYVDYIGQFGQPTCEHRLRATLVDRAASLESQQHADPAGARLPQQRPRRGEQRRRHAAA
jgi:prepilin-type N-terminal cleavage/methylation domain-containing protein